jgi:CO/xanthine dehydrogenase FAD-binding subunit
LGAQVTRDGKTDDTLQWSELSKELRHKGLKDGLITSISLNAPSGRVGAAYQQVGRTPADRPIVSAAAIAVESGDEIRLTVCVGGLLHDLLIINQTVKSGDANIAADQAVADIGKAHAPETDYQSDFRGSAEYRRQIAPVLARRAVLDAFNRLRQPIVSA